MRRFSVIAMAAMLAMALSACTDNKGKENKMIRLNVTVTAYEEHFNEVLDELVLLAAKSQKEEGCMGYEVYKSTVNPIKLIIVETWKDQAALDAHALTEHYTTILPPLRDKMEDMKLERFEF